VHRVEVSCVRSGVGVEGWGWWWWWGKLGQGAGRARLLLAAEVVPPCTIWPEIKQCGTE
jgi:hypothetical protein